MDTYRHEPIDLQRPAFRLLRLCKGTNSDVECELFHAFLDGDDLIDYEALSYTWGGMEMSASIQVDGRTLAVTENLYMALQHLRSQDTDRILWVDAICIDQSNYQERGHQVQQMGNVYAQADRVIFWLGLATDDTDVLMDSLKRLEEESMKRPCKDWKLADKRWTDLWSSLQLNLMNRHWNLAYRQRSGLELLLARPWFQRVWILQEVANAKRAIICSGTKSLSARIFALAPVLIFSSPEPHCQAVLDIMPGPSRKDSWWSQTRDLYTLILKFKDSKAGDPRDMIYALLGICSDAQDAHKLRADYTKDYAQLVHDTASFLFGLSDCSCNTMAALLRDIAVFNDAPLKKVIKSGNVEGIADFLRRRGSEVEITEKMLVGVVKNTGSGKEVIAVFLEQLRGSQVRITPKVLEAAAKKQYGKEVIVFLHKQRGEEVVIAAAECIKEVMSLLLEQRGSDVEITERVLEAAARNKRSGEEVITLLLAQRGSEVIITEEVLRAAAGNTVYGMEILAFLFEQRGNEITITEEVLKGAAGNRRQGKEVFVFLIEQRGSEITITEEVLKAALMNNRCGREVLAFLLEQQGSKITMTEEVLKAAASDDLVGERFKRLQQNHRMQEESNYPPSY